MKQYDPQSIAERIIDRLQTKQSQQKILFTGANRRYVDAIAEEFADGAQEREYLLREAKFSLARENSSILAQTDFFPYTPHRKIGAKGPLRVSSSETFDADYPFNITIPKYFRFTSEDLNFAAVEDSVITAGQDFTDIQVVQGSPRTKKFDIAAGAYPEGTTYIELEINNPNFENDIFDVFVNGVQWQAISNLRLADSGEDFVYRLRNKPDFSGIIIEFGNDVFGKKLVNSVPNEAKDSQGADVEIFCTNTDPVVGGSEVEDIESIRANAPQSYKTGNRAISREDYEVLISRTGIPDRVIVWGEEQINEDLGNPPGTFLPAEANRVYISGFSIDRSDIDDDPELEIGFGVTLTQGNQTSIRNVLNELKPPTDIIQFIDTEFIYVRFFPKVFIDDRRFSDKQVSASVRESLQKAYNLTQTQHRENLYFSEYFRVIQGVEGVRNHRTDLSFLVYFKFDSTYEFFLDLGLSEIKPGTVELYGRSGGAGEDWFLIAKDENEDGNLIGQPEDPQDPQSNTYTLPSATIDYSTGEGGDILITSGLTEARTNYDLRVEFELESDITKGNLELTRRQQIFSYFSTEVTTVREV